MEKVEMTKKRLFFRIPRKAELPHFGNEDKKESYVVFVVQLVFDFWQLVLQVEKVSQIIFVPSVGIGVLTHKNSDKLSSARSCQESNLTLPKSELGLYNASNSFSLSLSLSLLVPPSAPTCTPRFPAHANAKSLLAGGGGSARGKIAATRTTKK